MFDKTLSKLSSLAVHLVGNKSKEEELRLSNAESGIDTPTLNIVWFYLNNAFKNPEYFQFVHPSGLDYNNVYQICKGLFEEPSNFLDSSKKLAQMLFDVSDHPQVKSGELMVIYFERLRHLQFDGPAIALFKSEQKQPFLFTEEEEEVIELYSYQGINPSKVDKAALIFASDQEEGYQVLSVDNINKGDEAKFWFEQFLRIQVRSNEFVKTAEIIKMTKSFIDQDLQGETELDRSETLEFYGRSKEYFEVHEQYKPEEFSKEVFDDEAVADRFREYVKSRDVNDLGLDADFEVSQEAYKKKERVFKSVLKLDKNFHIYIHGDRSKISKGEEADGRKFYKVYYDEEH